MNFEDRKEKYEYLRINRVAYFQSIFTGFFTASILYALTEVLPEFLSNIELILTPSKLIELLIVKLIILPSLIILTLIFHKKYLKSVIQTQKPLVMSYDTVGTLEGYRIVKGKDGKKLVVANVTDTVEDNPISNKK